MHEILAGAGPAHATPKRKDAVDERLRQCIEKAAHLLPAQGPIGVFIHHNTLHAFENVPFEEGVLEAGRLFGAQPFLGKARFRDLLKKGRILAADLEAVLRGDLGDGAASRVVGSCTRFGLRLAMLENRLQFGPSVELRWFMAETDALRRIRPDVSASVRSRLVATTRHWAMRDLRSTQAKELGNGNDGLASVLAQLREPNVENWSEHAWEALTLRLLWYVCRRGMATLSVREPVAPKFSRPRDLLLRAANVDVDLPVHELLIRFCAAFLDQGLGRWQLPDRGHGFYRTFCALYRQPFGAPEAWRSELARELARLADNRISPLESIRESLAQLAVADEDWQPFITSSLLALRGWAGMIHFLEERPDRAHHPVPAGSLVEFLAIRLVLDRLAVEAAARELIGCELPWVSLQGKLRQRLVEEMPVRAEQRAFLVFQLAQILGWTPEALQRLNASDWAALVEEVEAFTPLERRRIFHLAFERSFYIRALDALTLHAQRPTAPPSPRYQAVFCIDEREESMRRHLEEVEPGVATYGIAGFFFVDMYYQGAGEAHYVPLCPPVINPGHWVRERPVSDAAAKNGRRVRTRRALGLIQHQLHVGSRKLAAGALLSALLGVLATLPLVLRTLFPRLAARLRERAGRIILEPAPTKLVLERCEEKPGPENGHIGFSLNEMSNIAERVLRDTGLTRDFCRLVFLFGHGSTSLNNPHESAHDCGACGGSRGGPNARALAQMLNDRRVRSRLAARGLAVPEETVFVGGMHNTSSEELTFFDVKSLPQSHQEEFEQARRLFEEAADRNAHERCRRFESAPLDLSPRAARQHVEGRAEDLSQVRPEWGHATNAITIVARRARTRGLFLDRRAFLNSYDPTQDDAEGSILTRILQAAIPVCAGISLEYYFSYVDNSVYGCGTKLPHNIAALLGVMDGAASDLRTGLPWQMVEIHEPVRQLFIIETTAATMLGIMDRVPALGQLIRHGWVRLALLDPYEPVLQVFVNGQFIAHQVETRELPRAACSADWYAGWREHLDFAAIGD